MSNILYLSLGLHIQESADLIIFPQFKIMLSGLRISMKKMAGLSFIISHNVLQTEFTAKPRDEKVA
jgi:hypothetical protein